MTPGTLKAYIVALSFEPPGPLHVNTWVAPDAPSAAALATVHFMRQRPTEENLLACLVIEMGAEGLRHLLRTVEGKLPNSGNAEVLSLVPKPSLPCEKPPLDAADASTFTGSNVDRLWKTGPGSAQELGEDAGMRVCQHGRSFYSRCLECENPPPAVA